MGLTVRYPSGIGVTYNDATYLSRNEHGWSLYTDSTKTKWIASVQLSAGATIESVQPCAVKNGTEPPRRDIHWKDIKHGFPAAFWGDFRAHFSPPQQLKILKEIARHLNWRFR